MTKEVHVKMLIEGDWAFIDCSECGPVPPTSLTGVEYPDAIAADHLLRVHNITVMERR